MNKEQKAQALDDLKVLNGDPPHDTWSNHAAHDGYYAQSLRTKYGMDLDTLAKKCGYKKWKKKERKARKQYERSLGIG